MGQSIDRLHAARLELYRKKGAIHARAVSGRFNTWRWIMVWITQAVFYGGCWLEWNANGTVRQAILFDIAHEKLYFFGQKFICIKICLDYKIIKIIQIKLYYLTFLQHGVHLV